jgi:predicted nucleic acid-binding Zn ribbon protein
MAEVKVTKPVQDRLKKSPRDRSVELISVKRARKRDTKWPLYLIIAIFVIVMVLLVSGAMKKKPAGSRLATTKSRVKEAPGRGSKKDLKQPTTQARAQAPRAAPPRPAAERRRETGASRGERRRAARVKLGAKEKRASRGSVRQGSESGQITGIAAGAALIGRRTVRSGDVIGGRIIREVGPDFVRVEYGGVTYTLRIGEELP